MGIQIHTGKADKWRMIGLKNRDLSFEGRGGRENINGGRRGGGDRRRVEE